MMEKLPGQKPSNFLEPFPSPDSKNQKCVFKYFYHLGVSLFVTLIKLKQSKRFIF